MALTINRVTSLEEAKKLAKDISKNAYAPYSGFSVGAVALTGGNLVFPGVNIENASYGMTCCAERSAIFSMLTAGVRSLSHLFIYTPTQDPTPPCGACRQVIAEMNRRALVTSFCDSDKVISCSIEDLLPGAFTSTSLGFKQ